MIKQGSYINKSQIIVHENRETIIALFFVCVHLLLYTKALKVV